MDKIHLQSAKSVVVMVAARDGATHSRSLAEPSGVEYTF